MDLAYSEYSHFHLPLANMHDIASSLFRGLIGLLNYHSRNLPFGKAQTSLALHSLNRALNYHSRNLPFGKAQTSLALHSLNR